MLTHTNKPAVAQSRAEGASSNEGLAANWTMHEIAEAIEQAHMAGQYRDGAGCDPSAYDAMVYRKRIMAANAEITGSALLRSPG